MRFIIFLIIPFIVCGQINSVDSNGLKQGNWQLFFPFNSDSVLSEEGVFVNMKYFLALKLTI